MKRIKTIKSLILCALSFSATIQTETNQQQEIPLTAAEQEKVAKLIEFSEKALLKSQSTLFSLEDPGVNLEYSYLFTEFCNAFVPYLTTHIKTGFKNAQPFDIKSFFMTMNKNKKRGNLQHLNQPSLMKGLKKTRSELKLLNDSVGNIGL